MVEDSQPTPQPDLVPLKLQFNDRFDWLMNRSLTQRPKDTVVHDGGTWFSRDDISLSGIPFHVVSKSGADNLVPPPLEPKENEEIIEHFGVKGPRGVMAPVSRDSRITVPVNREASEVFLLLAVELPNREKGFFLRHCPTTLDSAHFFDPDLGGSHGLNERIRTSSLYEGRDFLYELVKIYASSR